MESLQDEVLNTLSEPETIQEGDFGELLAIRFYPQTPGPSQWQHASGLCTGCTRGTSFRSSTRPDFKAPVFLDTPHFRNFPSMHEWALAEGVVTTALKAADKEGLRQITKIVVSIGELQQVETEIFRHALQEVMPASEPRLESAEFALQTASALFRCRICGREFTFSDATGHLSEEESEAIHFIPELAHTCFRCPGCGSTDFEVVRGRGVWIDRIEGEV